MSLSRKLIERCKAFSIPPRKERRFNENVIFYEDELEEHVRVIDMIDTTPQTFYCQFSCEKKDQLYQHDAYQEDGLTGFWHHGRKLSDGTVVHYSGMQGVKTLRDAVVQLKGKSELDNRPFVLMTPATFPHRHFVYNLTVQ